MVVEYAMPEPLQQRVQLQHKGIDEERIRQCTPSIPFHKSHQEPEAYQHHYVDVLEHWVVGLIEFRVIMGLDADKDSIQDHDNSLAYPQQNYEPETIFLVGLLSFLLHIVKFY